MNSPREDSVRRAESEIRDVIDAIPAMVWIAAPDGKATFINRAWTEYLGLSPEEEKCGRLGCGSVRRLRRQDFELFADYAGLELHGAALSPARRSLERQLEISRSAARELISA